uniref:Trans-2,3-enoyl-CoA reductase-like 2b n=1 Tax=Myripristis murdjan TaxID=586833 RepID=A0A668AJ63_9TELE
SKHMKAKNYVFFEVEILDSKKLQLCFLDKVEPNATIGEIKCLLHNLENPPAVPLCFQLSDGKSLRDDDVLENLPVGTTATMFFHDLGPQLGWTMVFLAQCVGPLFLYLLFYFRLPNIYLHEHNYTRSPYKVVKLACVCHSFHYIKKLFEIIFIHRFSHGTMPLRTIMWNCLYYWGFAAWMAYYINHPLYTPPGDQMECTQDISVVALSHSSSLATGSRPKSIPYPTKNPFTWLFFLVSCPNYTYETGAWLSFSIMTQCAPVALFTFISFIQMTIWAREKQEIYTREFISYPELRSAIVPLFL